MGKLKAKSKATLDILLSDPKTNPTQAYLKTHSTTNRRTAEVNSSKLLSKTEAKIYMKEHVQLAKQTIVQIVGDETVKPDTRIKAAVDILDRTQGKAVQRSEVKTENLNLNVQASQELSDSFTAFLLEQTRAD